MKKTKIWVVLAALAAGGLLVYGQKTAQKSFLLRTETVEWAPMPIKVVPPGLQQRLLHENKEKGSQTAVVRFPAGYREPRHYHTTCGHSLYILKGRLESPEGPLTPGTFVYSAPQERHGPFLARVETELLFFTDGPLDFFVEDKK
ncbi:MAG: cupin domain-containing protein [Acidobacteria bacterium]|nr:cupin domain-containing protein [Acidobacteriota bacterium]